MGKWFHYLGNAFWGLEFVFSIHEIVMDWKFDGSLLANMLGIAPYAQSIFVPLAIVGFFFLMYHNIVWFSKRTKRYRFYELRPCVDKIISSKREERHTNMAIFAKELERFKVKSPTITDTRTWTFWLPHMAALIQTKSLKEARKLDPAKLVEEMPPPTY